MYHKIYVYLEAKMNTVHVHHFKLQTTCCHHSVIPRDFSDHAWVPLENPRTAQPPPPFKMPGLKFWVLEAVFFFVVTDSLPTSKKGKQKHVLGIWNYKVITGYNYILITDVFGLGKPFQKWPDIAAKLLQHVTTTILLEFLGCEIPSQDASYHQGCSRGSWL